MALSTGAGTQAEEELSSVIDELVPASVSSLYQTVVGPCDSSPVAARIWRTKLIVRHVLEAIASRIQVRKATVPAARSGWSRAAWTRRMSAHLFAKRYAVFRRLEEGSR